MDGHGTRELIVAGNPDDAIFAVQTSTDFGCVTLLAAKGGPRRSAVPWAAPFAGPLRNRLPGTRYTISLLGCAAD